MLGVVFPDKLDAHGYTGVTFWVGAGEIPTHPVMFLTQGIIADRELPCPIGRAMSRGCVALFDTPVLSSLSGEWQRFEVPFAAMSRLDGENLVEGNLDLQVLEAFSFMFPLGAFDFWIDDLALY